VNNADPMKTKQLNKGLSELMDEGLAQLFTKEDNNRKIIGTVGALQFDVIQYRLEHEYGAMCTYEPVYLYKACWVEGTPDNVREFVKRRTKDLARDKQGRLVYLAETAWALKTVQEAHPNIKFHFSDEF
jgi:peptide chain release factor 3